MIRVRVLVLCAVLALSAGVASATAGGGNSDNAKLCQKGGWQTWLRADHTSFANQGACVSYGAQGGILTTFTTSTTSHTTFTRVDLPTIQAYLTRVVSSTDAAVVTYDQTLQSSPASAETGAALQAARQALTDFLIETGGSGTVLISNPSFLPGTQTTETVYVGDQLDHTETSTTTTITQGPATVLIGPNQSQAFSVVAGTQNINTDTHAETFVNQRYQTTITNSATYLITGSVQ